MSPRERFFQDLAASYKDNEPEQMVPELTNEQIEVLCRLFQIRRARKLTEEEKSKLNAQLKDDVFRRKCLNFLYENHLLRGQYNQLERRATDNLVREEAEF